MRTSNNLFLFVFLYYQNRSLIQAISSKTGELIGNFNGHTALISRIVDCPATSAEEEKKGSANVISTSIDGFLIVWNKVIKKFVIYHFYTI